MFFYFKINRFQNVVRVPPVVPQLFPNGTLALSGSHAKFVMTNKFILSIGVNFAVSGLLLFLTTNQKLV